MQNRKKVIAAYKIKPSQRKTLAVVGDKSVNKVLTIKPTLLVSNYALIQWRKTWKTD